MISLFTQRKATECVVDACFNLTLKKEEFVSIEAKLLFEKILKKCAGRSEGLTEEEMQSLWDSSDAGDAPRGGINLIAEAMANKNKIYLVYKAGLITKATTAEQKTIEADYKDGAGSTEGVCLDFTNYKMADIVKFYYNLVFDVFKTARVNLGLSQSVKYKMHKLRETTSIFTSENIIEQAGKIAKGLKDGKSAVIDALDNIEVNELKSQAISEALYLVYSRLASELSMPISFVSGELTTGMSVSGEADANAVDEGVRDFFISVFKPFASKIFRRKVFFKTDNWRKLKENIEVLPYIESSSILTDEEKRAFVETLFPKAEK